MVALVTGASGLLGTWLRRTAPPPAELVSVVHRTPLPHESTVLLDLRDRDAVIVAFEAVRPSVVIHAAMALDQTSIVDASAHVAEAAAACGAGLVFISTDAVFSGHGQPVAEDDVPDPIWDYGRWKAEAEASVVQAVPDAAIVRLPLVISLDPPDATARAVVAAAEHGGPSRWFHDEVRQPAMASDLAAGIWRIAQLPADRRAGPWHLMGCERLSRHQIAVRAALALGHGDALVGSEPTPPSLVRPRDLFLGCNRAVAEISWDPAPILG